MSIQVSARNLPARSLVRVPSGVGVLVLWADDPLKTSYTVLFAECKKRGIPISLCIPSTMSSLAPAGTEAGAVWGLLRATDAQVAEMCLKGGAGFVYHSTSHGQFSGQSDKGWFKNEVALGADIDQSLPGLTGLSELREIDRANLTPGDRISAQIPTQLSYGPATEMYLSAQGFVAPGQWYEAAEADSVNTDNEYWDILRAKWGQYATMYGGRYFQPIGAMQPMALRHTMAIGSSGETKTTANILSIIDAAIASGTCVNLYCHEFLTSGGEGSEKPAKSSYSAKIPNADLVTILNYIQTKMEAGTLKVLSFGASCVAETGTAINLLENGDLGKMSWNDPTVKPSGWARLRYQEASNATLGRRAATAGDLAHVYIDRTANANTGTLMGWYTVFDRFDNCESFLLRGKVRIKSGGNKPRILIYGGLSSDTLKIKDGSTVFEATDIQNHAGSLTGLFNQLLYKYEFDDADARTAPLVEYNLDNTQNVVDESIDDAQHLGPTLGAGICSVLASTHGFVSGDLVWFHGFDALTSVYLIDANTTASKIYFKATYAAEAVQDGDTAHKVNWTPFTIPFGLPKPLSRIAIVLSVGATSGTSEIGFADIVLEQNGPQVDAKKVDLSDLRIAGDTTGRDRYGNVLI